LPSIPERLDSTDPLLAALESHANSRRPISRQMSEGSISVSYGEAIKVSWKQNGLHRRGWSSTGDVCDSDPGKDRRKRSARRCVQQHPSSSSVHLTSEEGETEIDMPETPALTRASSFNQSINHHGPASVTTPTTATTINPSSPPLVTPVDLYHDRQIRTTVDGEWHSSIPPDYKSDFLDFHDRNSKGLPSDWDAFAHSERKTRPTEHLRHTSSTPALPLYHQRKPSLTEPDFFDDDNDDFDTSEDDHTIRREKSIFSRLRSFSFAPSKGLSKTGETYSTSTYAMTLGGL
jgi:hypothetical protein